MYYFHVMDCITFEPNFWADGEDIDLMYPFAEGRFSPHFHGGRSTTQASEIKLT
jgi:hypothetical protein